MKVVCRRQNPVNNSDLNGDHTNRVKFYLKENMRKL